MTTGYRYREDRDDYGDVWKINHFLTPAPGAEEIWLPHTPYESLLKPDIDAYLALFRIHGEILRPRDLYGPGYPAHWDSESLRRAAGLTNA